ncbi:3'-5' exonuclease [Patescibacteria group bacterium]|nr:3'-5' exonuclease [Patescibacteria group bacterium]MBU1500963.1 3'-5' exonuclease [Patescibacteria group bacterium]MBU2080593.1 3'-5' exonuclease [Patescibacteria group bacterium]MBU2124332.1 3'-5' exonuclease [Patescibacteria group bacterium]MBU2194458.1 3'-5' exonuclease [Patescibacteria group bacterium]
MIVLDVESTGLVPESHSILSIGALDLGDPTNQFYEECRIWEGAAVDEDALRINGFTEEEITSPSRQTEEGLIRAFVAWATDRPKDRTLAAQNPSFDLEFVQAACKRAGIECPFAKRTIDVHTLVWMHMTERGVEPPQKHAHSAINLDFALQYCGIPEEPKPHNALTGAFCHAEVISRIAYNKKTLPDFNVYDIPWETNQ